MARPRHGSPGLRDIELVRKRSGAVKERQDSVGEQRMSAGLTGAIDAALVSDTLDVGTQEAHDSSP